MKTIILLIALTGFTAFGGYAQNKTCACKHKAHKAVAHKAVATNTPSKTNDETAVLLLVPENETTCYRYNKDNIVVTECPNVFYDNSDDVAFDKEGDYSGYYPTESNHKPANTTTTICANKNIAAGTPTQQHTVVIEQCDAPSDPYLRLYNWPRK